MNEFAITECDPDMADAAAVGVGENQHVTRFDFRAVFHRQNGRHGQKVPGIATGRVELQHSAIACPEGQGRTQIRAARSLGMTATQAYTRIVIPQVLRMVYYPITNQMVWAVLISSLGMLVGFRELSGETQFFASKTYRIFEYFAVTAVLYYVIVKIILLASRLLAMKLFKY